MSFILDALKKVEREQRGRETPARSMIAFSAAGSGGGRQYLMMGTIAVVSAGVTAAIFFGVSGGKTGAERPELLEPAETPATATAASASPPVVDVERGEEAFENETVGAVAPPAPEAPAPKENAVVALPRPAVPSPPEASAVEPTVAEVVQSESASVPAPDEPTHPIHIIGRERAAQGALERDTVEASSTAPPESAAAEASGSMSPTPMDEDTTAAASDEAGSSSTDLPSLVLQGTSVLDGNAVAVISEQRVFEGDWIEGARVVTIREREVELEFEGRVFTLRL